MTLEALKKAANSSKVLIFLVFAIAITVVFKLQLVQQEWYQATLREAFLALMGGYSLVEVARAAFAKRVSVEAVIDDPKAALDALKEKDTIKIKQTFRDTPADPVKTVHEEDTKS